MTITLSALQKQRYDTAANWTAENPTLLAGEIGVESDTGKIKIGTGATAWTSLSYSGLIPGSGVYPYSQLLMPSGTAGAPSISFDGDGDSGIYRTGANAVAISTNGSAKLSITSDGDIRTVWGSDRFFGSYFSSAYYQGLLFDGGTSKNLKIVARAGDTSADILFLTGLNTTPTEKARITSDGKLGLGTSTPSNALHIEGSSPSIRLKVTSGPRHMISPFSGDLYIEADPDNSSASTNMIFTVDGGEAVRIDSSQRLLVGTSTSIGFGGLLQVVGGDTARPQVHRNVNDEYPAVIYISKARGTGVQAVSASDQVGSVTFTAADGAGQLAAAEISCAVDGTPGASDMPGRLVFSTTADGASSPTERMRITSSGQMSSIYVSGIGHRIGSTLSAGSNNLIQGGHSASDIANMTTSFIVSSNGNVTNTNNSYGAISDIKLKENIVDASSQWDDLKALQVRNYNFKEETGQQTHTQIGLIAQEAELVSPGLVTESTDRDAEGNDLGTVTKSVNYSVLYMKAVKALQEAMERIEVLEAKVNALEGN